MTLTHISVFWDDRKKRWVLIIPEGTNKVIHLTLLTPQDGVTGKGEQELRHALTIARRVVKNNLGFTPHWQVKQNRWDPETFYARASVQRWDRKFHHKATA